MKRFLKRFMKRFLYHPSNYQSVNCLKVNLHNWAHDLQLHISGTNGPKGAQQVKGA